MYIAKKRSYGQITSKDINLKVFSRVVNYFLLKPNKDLMALMALSLMKDSSNCFMSGSNFSDFLMFSKSGSLRILCKQKQSLSFNKQHNLFWSQLKHENSIKITLKSSYPDFNASSRAERPAWTYQNTTLMNSVSQNLKSKRLKTFFTWLSLE